MEAKSRPCVFTGYEASAGTYRLIDPAANFRLVITRDVIFHEDESGSRLCHQQLSTSNSERQDFFASLLQGGSADLLIMDHQSHQSGSSPST